MPFSRQIDEPVPRGTGDHLDRYDHSTHRHCREFMLPDCERF